MYLVFVMAVYFTIRDVQLIKGAVKGIKAKKRLPELQEPKEPEVDFVYPAKKVTGDEK